VAAEDTSNLTLTVTLALASALAFAVATVIQQRAAATSSDEDARSGRIVGQLIRNPRWLLGVATNTAGYGLQAAALAVGSVIVVQPILVTSLLFALPLSAVLARERLPSVAKGCAALLSVSLAAFVVLSHPNAGLDFASAHAWLVVIAVGVPSIAGCLVLANRRSGTVRASLLAVAVGVLGGVLAVLTKAVVTAAGDGLGALLSAGETYGLIVIGLGGFYLQQLAFQAGALRASLPIMIVLEPITAAFLGFALLHEHLQADGPRIVVLTASIMAMTLATVPLARAQATVAEVAGTDPALLKAAPRLGEH
jgi:drug/metabolite transporter (DMT)-like permease